MKKKQVALLLATTTGIATISIPSKNVHAIINNSKNTICKTNIEDTAIRTNIKKGKVTNVDTNLRIRKKTTINSEILGYLTNGQEFDIINQKGDWYEINHNGQSGYVHKDYVGALNSSNVKEIKGNFKKVFKVGHVINISSHLNIRSNPNLCSEVVGDLKKGQRVQIKGEQGNWYEIINDGRSAYVSKEYIKEGNEPIEVVNLQKQNKKLTQKCLDFSKGQVCNINSNLRVRAGVGTNNNVIGYLKNDEVFDIDNKIGDWYEINFNGHSGYVHKDYVKKASNDIINKLVKPENHSQEVVNAFKKVSNKGTIINVCTNLRLRQGAGTNSAIIGYLVNGQSINIKEKAGDWYKIECDGKCGFINKEYVSLEGNLDVASINPNATNTDSIVKVNKKSYGQVCNVSTNLRLRSNASSNSNIVAYLLPGTTFEIIESANSWNKISCDGKVGYISTNFVKEIDEVTAKKHMNKVSNSEVKNENSENHKDINNNEKTSDSSNKVSKGYQSVLNAMKSQLGAPYLFGGSGQVVTKEVLNNLKSQFPYNSSRGDYNVNSQFMNSNYRAFDCSGLMQWGFSQAGMNLGRTTWEQIGAGTEVAKNSVQPGDLLFFKNIEHVGMYIGNNQWIEAPKHGDVVKIASVPWSRVGRARRVLK